jgi:site-specific recombinase XerD
MTTAISALEITSTIHPIVSMVLDVVGERTRVEYRRALGDFMVWFQQTEQTVFNKAAVNAHIAALKAAGVPASSINQRLSAIRKLALEAADNDLIAEGQAQAIQRVEGVRVLGRKTGNWLSKEQAEQLIRQPNTATHKGRRDQAILAVMIGCGLRREEVCRLAVAHLQQRNERWVILDLSGKHGRVRSVPMAPWVKRLISQWLDPAGVVHGPLFRRIRRGDHIQPAAMTSQAIWNVVEQYADRIGVKVAPHDLRRTFAKLAYQGGSPIEQIQKSLGHASIKTTESYIGIDQDFDYSPSDAIQLRV